MHTLGYHRDFRGAYFLCYFRLSDDTTANTAAGILEKEIEKRASTGCSDGYVGLSLCCFEKRRLFYIYVAGLFICGELPVLYNRIDGFLCRLLRVHAISQTCITDYLYFARVVPCIHCSFQIGTMGSNRDSPLCFSLELGGVFLRRLFDSIL